MMMATKVERVKPLVERRREGIFSEGGVLHESLATDHASSSDCQRVHVPSASAFDSGPTSKKREYGRSNTFLGHSPKKKKTAAVERKRDDGILDASLANYQASSGRCRFQEPSASTLHTVPSSSRGAYGRRNSFPWHSPKETTTIAMKWQRGDGSLHTSSVKDHGSDGWYWQREISSPSHFGSNSRNSAYPRRKTFPDYTPEKQMMTTTESQTEVLVGGAVHAPLAIDRGNSHSHFGGGIVTSSGFGSNNRVHAHKPEVRWGNTISSTHIYDPERSPGYESGARQGVSDHNFDDDLEHDKGILQTLRQRPLSQGCLRIILKFGVCVILGWLGKSAALPTVASLITFPINLATAMISALPLSLENSHQGDVSGVGPRPDFVYERPYISSSYYTSTKSIPTLLATEKNQVIRHNLRREAVGADSSPDEAEVKRLAIVRPFRDVDAEALPATFASWDALSPCNLAGGVAAPKNAKADVFLFYSQAFAENESAIKAVDAIINQFFDAGRWSRCFDNIYAIEANVPQENPSAQEELRNWVNGTNRQIEASSRIIRSGEWGEYDAFYLVEGDSAQINAHWLDDMLSEIEINRPYATPGAQYNGDNWDNFYYKIPISLLYNTDGNGIETNSQDELDSAAADDNAVFQDPENVQILSRKLEVDTSDPWYETNRSARKGMATFLKRSPQHTVLDLSAEKRTSSFLEQSPHIVSPTKKVKTMSLQEMIEEELRLKAVYQDQETKKKENAMAIARLRKGELNHHSDIVRFEAILEAMEEDILQGIHQLKTQGEKQDVQREPILKLADVFHGLPTADLQIILDAASGSIPKLVAAFHGLPEAKCRQIVDAGRQYRN